MYRGYANAPVMMDQHLLVTLTSSVVRTEMAIIIIPATFFLTYLARFLPKKMDCCQTLQSNILTIDCCIKIMDVNK